jgi:hypothetical protein
MPAFRSGQMRAQADLGRDLLDPRAVRRRSPGRTSREGTARLLQRDAQVVPHALVLEDGGALELAADPLARDLRLGHRQERMAHLAPAHGALSGRVLPVTMSMKVVLPAPFGPITARISGRPMVKLRLLIALNPSKETETPLDLQKRAHLSSFRTR